MEAVEDRVQKIEEILLEMSIRSKDNQLAIDRITAKMEKNSDAIDSLTTAMEKDRNESQQMRKDLNKKWGELSNKLGTIIEDFVAPNIPTIAKTYFGLEELLKLEVRSIVKHKNFAQRREFDVIAIYENHVIFNFTRSNARTEYAKEFVKQLEDQILWDYFPELRGKNLIPVFSSLSIQENVIAYLTKQKVYAMTNKGETMDLVNFDDIQMK